MIDKLHFDDGDVKDAWDSLGKTVEKRKLHFSNFPWRLTKVTRPGGKAMAKFKVGDRVELIKSSYPTLSIDRGYHGTIVNIDGNLILVQWDHRGDNSNEPLNMYAYEIKLIKGGKPMKSKKEYKKGKTIYLQFNCPTNDDDMTMKGSPNKDDMNPDYPFTQVKLTGDVYEMQTVRKVVKVK